MNAHLRMADDASIPAVEREAAALVQALAEAGHRGPILLIADNAAIARSAPAWAGAFAARGWLHRVRLSDVASADAADIADEARSLASEARSLSSGVIVVVGGEATRTAALRAAAEAGLPVMDGEGRPAY